MKHLRFAIIILTTLGSALTLYLLTLRSTSPFGMKFVRIRAGSFDMGCAQIAAFRCDSDEFPVHKVTITRDFWLQETLVTQKQWLSVMGSNPSVKTHCLDCPVENVSWYDTQDFIAKLETLDPQYRYRLPTEAEWEYADRAGTRTVFPWGNEAVYQGKKIPLVDIAPTKTIGPNAWDLYDMNGLIWQWVQDWYANAYEAGPAVDPQGPATGTNKVARGGTTRHEARHSSASSRHADYADNKAGGFIGFRLVRESKP